MCVFPSWVLIKPIKATTEYIAWLLSISKQFHALLLKMCSQERVPRSKHGLLDALLVLGPLGSGITQLQASLLEESIKLDYEETLPGKTLKNSR